MSAAFTAGRSRTATRSSGAWASGSGHGTFGRHMTHEARKGSPILAVEDLAKAFGATQALAGVSLDVHAGEVHVLLGQNGSGKSTLIKILSGYHAPDAGSIFVRGQQVRLPFRPGEAHRFGLAFLHQDLSLVESMTV